MPRPALWRQMVAIRPSTITPQSGVTGKFRITATRPPRGPRGNLTHPLLAPSSGRVLVALPDQAEPGQRQQLVDLVDRRAERHDRAGEPARRQRAKRTQLVPQPRHDP